MFSFGVKLDGTSGINLSKDPVQNTFHLELAMEEAIAGRTGNLDLATLDSIDGTFYTWSLRISGGWHIEHQRVERGSNKVLDTKEINLSSAGFEIAVQLTKIHDREEFYQTALAEIIRCRAVAGNYNFEGGVGDFSIPICVINPEPDVDVYIAYNGTTDRFQHDGAEGMIKDILDYHKDRAIHTRFLREIYDLHSKGCGKIDLNLSLWELDN